MIDVPDVQRYPLIPGQVDVAVYLRPAGEARLDLQSSARPGTISRHLFRDGRSGTHEAHVTAKHAYQLREFVDLQPAKHAAYRGHHGVGPSDLSDVSDRRLVDMHAPALADDESP